MAPLAWALTLACFLAIVGFLPTARDFVPPRATAAISVTVSSADTLWSIAAAHRLPGMSTVQTVDSILAANGLTEARVEAGSVLSVPAQGVVGTALAQATP
jgi:Tfp pilus assembly protein FimV